MYAQDTAVIVSLPFALVGIFWTLSASFLSSAVADTVGVFLRQNINHLRLLGGFIFWVHVTPLFYSGQG